MTFVADGIITRINELGASDKLVNIITPDRGRIGVMVKGGKSPNSKLTAVSQLFTYGNFEIHEKNSMYWMKSGSISNSFYGLSSDIERVALATYLCDVANELTDEDEPCEELLRLLLNSLYLISKGEKDTALIKAAFELRIASDSGYHPELGGCAYCGSEVSEVMYLDVMGGKLICSDCLSKRGLKRKSISVEFEDIPEAGILCGLTPAALAAFRYIVYASPKKIFSFEMKDVNDFRDLSKATETYLLSHLGRNFDSLDFYKSVN